MACEGNQYGGFEHTLFLGCSVKGFSSSIGWNEQVSEVTVQIVQDTCAAPAERPKYYYDIYLNKQSTTAADPGFVGEQLDIIGCPAFFRMGEFEFCGLIQSWEKANTTSANPIYTVKLVAPINLLQNTQLILDEYTAGIKPNALFSSAPNNVINVYGFLEGVNGIIAPELYQDSPGVYLPGDGGIDGAVFGTAAGAFGGALKNNNGIQWSLIQNALAVLLSATPAVKNNWSPHGRLTSKGAILSPIGSPWTNAYGLLTADALVNGYYISQYYLDLSELPVPPSYFRIYGGNTTLLEAITRLCQESGFDYYLELIPIKNSAFSASGTDKVIKLRTVSRVAQPDLDQIQEFIADKQSDNTLVASSVGYEFRDDTTSAFLYGGPKETVYQTTGVCNPTLLSQEELDTYAPSGELTTIVPYVGTYKNGNMIVPHSYSQCESFFGGYFTSWRADFETDDLNNSLNYIDFGGEIVTISLGEFQAAMTSREEWASYVSPREDAFGNKITPDAGTTARIIWDFNPFDDRVIAERDWNKIIKRLERLKAAAVREGQAAGIHPKFIAAVARDFETDVTKFNAMKRDATSIYDTVSDLFEHDINRIFDFVLGIAQKYVGKTWAVRVPAVYGYLDPESNTPFYSDEPGQDGGWTEMPYVLDIPNPSASLDLFTNDKNKILPFLKFKKTNVLSSAVLENSLLNDQGLYIKCDVAQQYVFHDKDTLYIPRVIVSIEESTMDIADGIIEDIGGWDNVLEILNADQEDRKNILQGISTTVGEKSSFYRRYVIGDMPVAVAIPIKSNVHTYGPWSNIGPPGGTKLEQNDGLTPWEYGSYAAMNLAAEELMQAGITNTQVVEVGSVTVAGMPTLPLGVELNSANVLNGVHLVESRSATYSPYNGNFAGNSFSYLYLGAPSYGWGGSYGPNITNIDINVGEEITTTYGMRTFTPKFGRFSELNASRLKQIGQNRLKLLKEANSRIQNNASIAIDSNQKRNIGQRIASSIRKSETASRKYSTNTPHEFLIGELYLPNSGTLYGSGGMRPRALVGTYSSKDIQASLAAYEKKAYMSMDGLIRPVSMGGDGGLPRYSIPTGSGGQDTTQRYIVSTGYQVVGESTGTGVSNLITIRELNPFTNPAGYAWSELSTKHAGTMGHEIDVVGRGTGYPSGGLCMNIDNTGFDYRDDYRMFAFKIPMLLNGWCYDTQGKPIPNAADNDIDASGGIFKTTGLTDQFLPDFAHKPHTWPVGALDVRFDRSRGIFTMANNEPELYCQLIYHLGPNAPAAAIVLDSGTYYRESGSSGNITGYTAISGYSRTNNIYASGTDLKFRYSQTFSRWEVSQDSEVTILITGTIPGGTWDRNITGIKPTMFTAPTFGICTSTGLGSGWLQYNTGNIVIGWNRYPDSITVSAGQGKLAKICNGWLDNGSCQDVTL
jgi:hypothetical protein